MNGVLIIGGLGIVLVVLTPIMRALRLRSNSSTKDSKYFAAARKRAIRYRRANSANPRESEAAGDE